MPSLPGCGSTRAPSPARPAWLKPAKFAISTAIYCFTLAWVFLSLREWPRLRRVVGRITAVVIVGEVALIDLQAGRGTTSHFNVATPLDAVIFRDGHRILVQTLASIGGGGGALAAAVRRPRAGLGAAPRHDHHRPGRFTGGLDDPADRGPAGGGAGHAPDASARAPTPWARPTAARDCRHRLEHAARRPARAALRGLHALQAIPLLAWLARRRPERTRVRLTLAGAAAYALVFALLLVQALQARPLVALG